MQKAEVRQITWLEILSQFIGKLCFSKTHASMSYDEYGSRIITENTIPITAKM